jgi:hypothetical protein
MNTAFTKTRTIRLDIVLRLVLVLFTGSAAFSQTPLNKIDSLGRTVCRTIIVDKDTLPVIYLSSVNLTGQPVGSYTAEIRRWDRMVYYVKSVYPYAKLAGLKFNEYNAKISGLKSEKAKREMMKKAEEELKAQFGEELKKLTFTQGKILLKLLDRETGNSSYDLVVEFRGQFMAFFWQSFARLFGYNLRIKYDPLGEDADIERIVRMIENGDL